MSESFTERLSRLTPDGAGLDRDALLFAAGRASARPQRRWQALCAALAACQLMTLGMWWWPRPIVPSAPVDRGNPVLVESTSPGPVEEKDSLLQLRAQALATEGALPSTAFVELPNPSEAPGLALGRYPESLLQ